MTGSSEPDPVTMRAAYEAGASIATVGRQVGVGKDRARKLLLAAGTALRPPKGGTTGAMQTNSAERSRRVLVVLEHMADGEDCHAIHTYVNGVLGWNVEPRTVASYMIDARPLLRERTAEAAEDLRALLITRLELCWREAPDTKTKLDVVKERAKLGGAYPAQKLEHSGPNGAPIPLAHYPTEEILKTDEFRELERRTLEAVAARTGAVRS